MAAFCMWFLEVNVFPVEAALPFSMATNGSGPYLYMNYKRDLAPPQGSAICPHGPNEYMITDELWAVFSDLYCA